jgi:Lrp/AsnC family transcriptional regulator, leucine-responsive regulatory protein
MSMQIDGLDRKLLREVQRDSRRSVQVLGEAVGLSPSACHRRIKALEDEGYILGYHAELDADRLGFGMQFFIEVDLASQSEDALDAFESAVQDVPEILECFLMSGQSAYMLKVMCKDPEDFERLHRRLTARLPGVARLRANLCIRRAKSRFGMPI